MTIEEIKQSQIDNKISDKELCAMANVSVTTFWRYKNGKTEISVSKLKRLEKVILDILELREVKKAVTILNKNTYPLQNN